MRVMRASALTAIAIILFGREAVAMQLKDGATKVVVVTPDEVVNRHVRRLVEAALKTAPSPKGHKVRITWKHHVLYNRTFPEIMVPVNAAGKADGVEQYRGPLGHQVLHSVTYKNGLKDGPEKFFRSMQNKHYLAEEIPWKAGKVHGQKRSYYPDGAVRSETAYANGFANGPTRTLGPKGKLKRSGEMKDGKRHGAMTDYDTKTGKPRRIVHYVDGRVQGTVVEYYVNGKVKRESEFRDDARCGLTTEYDAKGAKTRERYYYDNEPVSKSEYERRIAKKK